MATSALGLYGGPQRAWAAFEAKTVAAIVTALNIELAASHPYGLALAATHPYGLTLAGTHPYGIAVTGGPTE